VGRERVSGLDHRQPKARAEGIDVTEAATRHCAAAAGGAMRAAAIATAAAVRIISFGDLVCMRHVLSLLYLYLPVRVFRMLGMLGMLAVVWHFFA